MTSKLLFINTSPNKHGNTVRIGENLLKTLDYKQLNLVDYHIDQLGQAGAADQFLEVIQEMQEADTIIIGTPVYWHAMGGLLKTLIDRLYELQDNPDVLRGKNLYFFMQGAAPTELAVASTNYIIERVAAILGMNLLETASKAEDVLKWRLP